MIRVLYRLTKHPFVWLSTSKNHVYSVNLRSIISDLFIQPGHRRVISRAYLDYVWFKVLWLQSTSAFERCLRDVCGISAKNLGLEKQLLFFLLPYSQNTRLANCGLVGVFGESFHFSLFRVGGVFKAFELVFLALICGGGALGRWQLCLLDLRLVTFALFNLIFLLKSFPLRWFVLLWYRFPSAVGDFILFLFSSKSLSLAESTASFVAS